MRLSFTVNGKKRTLDIDTSMRLLDVLRDELHLTGVKEGCGEGECGACTVLLDGKPVTSCLVPAAACEGREVETIEGIVETPIGNALVNAFAECGAVQCGFCTPGMIVSASALLQTQPSPTPDNVRVALAGNLCRCTGYKKIVEAVITASQNSEEK